VAQEFLESWTHPSEAGPVHEFTLRKMAAGVSKGLE